MEDLLEMLIALLSVHKVTFEAEKASDARALAALQHNLYQSLTGVFRTVNFHEGTQAGSVESTNIADAVFDWVAKIAIASPAIAGIRGDKTVVSSILPILQDNAVQQLMAFVGAPAMGSRSIDVAKRFAPMLAAALMVETEDQNNQLSVLNDGLKGAAGFVQLRCICEYAAAKAAIGQQLKLNTSLEADIAATNGAVDNYKIEFEQLRDKQRTEMNNLAGATANFNKTFENYASDIDASKERLENFESTIREELRLDRSRLTWENRFKEARISFAISCGLIAAYLVTTIVAAIHYGLPIITSLAAVEQANAAGNDSVAVALTHQFGRLIIFSVPIFVYLWTLRAVMRFFMRSMLLMDDARQRQTMLDTYFLLSEKGRADERDRPLILWALFRQTPGHGPDGIEPPDFTEVINAGLKRAGEG